MDCESLRDLLLDEKNELHNRSMHISGKFSNIAKADIEAAKADIGTEKADIEARWGNIDNNILSKTRNHIEKLYDEFGTDKIFGRSMVERITGLKSTRASELIKMMLDNDIIEPVQGHGKGKYRFR